MQRGLCNESEDHRVANVIFSAIHRAAAVEQQSAAHGLLWSHSKCQELLVISTLCLDTLTELGD